MKVDLTWLSIEKVPVIDLDKLDIRVPYGDETQYTISFKGINLKSDSLRYGLIMLLINTGVVNSKDPDKILKAIEKLSGENGKKLIRSALEETQAVKEVRENS